MTDYKDGPAKCCLTSLVLVGSSLHFFDSSQERACFLAKCRISTYSKFIRHPTGLFLCFPPHRLPHGFDCQMAPQQWILPAYQPAPTFVACCVPLKNGFSIAWRGSNHQPTTQIFLFFPCKSTYLLSPFSHLKCIATC